MPANSKYLTQSFAQRFAKISAGFVGGYLVSVTLHIALATWLKGPLVIISGSFSIFLVWTGLFVMTFLADNGWKIWGVFLALSLLFTGIGYLGLWLNQ